MFTQVPSDEIVSVCNSTYRVSACISTSILDQTRDLMSQKPRNKRNKKETKIIPLVHKFPSLATLTESSQFASGNLLLISGINNRGAVTSLPFTILAYPRTNAPVQILKIGVLTAKCARTKSRYSSAGGMALGGGPGISRISNFPGETAESVSESVNWRDICEVVLTVLFGPLWAM